MTVEAVFDFNYGGSNKFSSLETIKDDNGVANIFTPRIQSYNFNGTLNTVNTSVTASSVLVGYKIYLNADKTAVLTTTPSSGAEDFFVVSKADGSTASYVVFTVIIDGVPTAMPEILKTTTIPALREDWSGKSIGDSGWMITSEGNAIFGNIAVRGTIEALSGKFGDWEVGPYNSYDGLYYSYNDGTSIIESAVGPLNVYLKSDTIFGNYSWNITSAVDANAYMIVLRDLSKATTPFDLQPIFYVRDTGHLYSMSGEFENYLTSYGPFAAYSDGTAPSADLYTNYTGENAIHAHQTNTGQTATVLRLDSARTTTLSSYHFIRAYSAVGTAADEEFQVLLNGVTRGDGAYSSPTADYAEFFEWEDGNPSSEDRVGYSVSLVGNKIKIAELGETPIGIISATPSVIGDSPWNRWKDKYLKDEFGRELYEPCVIYQWEENKKLVNYFSDRVPDGITVPEDKEVINSERKVLNPDFNEELEYLSRDDRPEWDTVGLLGKIRLRKGQITAPTWIKLRDISENVEEWLVK